LERRKDLGENKNIAMGSDRVEAKKICADKDQQCCAMLDVVSCERELALMVARQP
jgi:hypothetical protein